MNARTNQRTAGRRATERRGTALILVLGVLALLAVLAAVYIAVGRADQRTARAVERKQRVSEFGSIFADHVAGVIAENRLAIHWDHLGRNEEFARRAAFDYPFTDYSLRSVNPGGPTGARTGQSRLRFRPSGNHPDPWGSSGDPRVPHNPWLASTLPTYLGDPSNRPSLPGFSGGDPFLFYLDNRDWAQISNVAPDGRFVNLVNLRNNFDAEPGIQSGQMSDNLSLLNLRQDGSGRLQATTEGYWVPGTSWQAGPQGNLDPNVPAQFTMNQRFMFMPLGDSPLVFARNGQLAGWDSPDFPLYQYADADGDGFADSRWFELTDATDPNNIAWLAPPGEYRLFAAVRVEDLSSRVNVNVATDGLLTPTNRVPWGLTPAEVDLRRALTMQDQALAYNGLSLSSLRQPFPVQRPRQPTVAADPASDYRLYEYLVTGNPPEPAGDQRASLIGRYAYDAIGESILRTESLVPPDLTGFQPANPNNQARLHERSRFENVRLWNQALDINEQLRRRARYYEEVGSLDPGDRAARAASDYELGRGLFGLTDLAELLTYRGIADPSTTSRLEQAMLGRFDDGGGPLETTRRLSPLLTGRGLDLDRRHDTRDITQSANPNRPQFPDGRTDPESMALHALSPRRILTTHSGAAPIRPRVLGTSTNLAALDQQARRIDAVDGRSRLRSVLGGQEPQATQSMFARVADALLPYSSIQAAWQRGSAEFERVRTLFYGYRGAELALRIAAHAAVNLRDSYDTDGDPTVRTLIVDRTFRNTLDGGRQNPDNNPFVWWREGARLDLGDARLAPNAGSVTARAVNVYGLEAHPVITEVAGLVMYTDAPWFDTGTNLTPSGGPGGDRDDVSPIPIDLVTGQPRCDLIDDETAPNITIDGSTDWENNSDIVLQLLAFQLTNPYDHPISLAGQTGPAGQPRTNFRYYIEYGGRFFKLVSRADDEDLTDPTDDASPVLQPGESRVFFVIANNSFDAIQTRWSEYLERYGWELSEGAASAWVRSQLRIHGQGDGRGIPVRAYRFDPRTGEDVVVGTYDNIMTNPASSVRQPEWNEARLWRRISTEYEEVNGFNSINTDLLVDRIREPVATLDGADQKSIVDQRLLYTGSREVSGTVAGLQNSTDPVCVRDNTGWTVARWGSFRRADEAETRSTRRGELPSWMLERRTRQDSLNRIHPPTEFRAQSGSVPNASDFRFSENEYAESLREMIRPTNRPRQIIKTITRHPDLKRQVAGGPPGEGPTDPEIIGDGNNDAGKFPAGAIPVNRLNQRLWEFVAGAAPEVPNTPRLNPTVYIDNNAFRADAGNQNRLRLADTLLTLGVGASRTPAPNSNGQTIEDGEWMTVGEALAFALGYGAEPGTGAGQDENGSGPYHIFQELTSDTGDEWYAGVRRYVLDRGNLRVDDYAPFYNVSDYAPFYNVSGGDGFNVAQDRRVSPGVPLAMSLLDAFRALDEPTGSTTMVRGTININTAPPEVLRLLPGLTPSLEADSEGNEEWWADRLNSTDLGLPRSQGTNFPLPDIASSLVAYRDRTRAPTRPQSILNNEVLDFDLGGDTGVGASPGQRATLLAQNLRTEQGRAARSGILALRETPGFASIGEALAVRVNPLVPPGDLPFNPNDVRHNRMDFLGIDGQTLGTADLTDTDAVATALTALYRGSEGGSTTERRRGGTAEDGYAEQLAMYNAIANSIDVRSDVFAVWMVVHGYRRADVEGLGDEDPMIPSFARRYMMVVDRSEVGTEDDNGRIIRSPKILLFREVPM